MINLIRSDTFRGMRKLKADSIDLVICDPPYGTTNIEWDKPLDLERLWRHYSRVVRPGGTIILFGNMPYTAQLVLSNVKWFKQCLIWDKNKCGSPGLAKIRPMQTHEDVIIFQKPKNKKSSNPKHHNAVYNPQMVEGAPYERRAAKQTRCNNHGYGLKSKDIQNSGTRYPKSIVRISRDFSAQQQVHPTQKPVPLGEWLVLTYSNPGDVVLDNTMGSGFIAKACANTDRKFYGIERSKEYFARLLADLRDMHVKFKVL